MEAIKRMVKTPSNHKITIEIPEYIPKDDVVEVILIMRNQKDTRKDKIMLIKQAIKDPLYLKDMEEVNNDFEEVDLKEWE